jgi:two-component system, NtrC family, response regulator HydG
MKEQTHILVVDDNLSMAKTIASILAFKGYAVHCAYSGSEALKILYKLPVDILLTDIKMPGMNGVELYREIRKVRPRLITYLMTAYASSDILQQGIDDGIEDVLLKPLDIERLLSLLAGISNKMRK